MRGRIFVAVMLALPVAWLFGPLLVTGKMLIFRDVAQYYQPLWQWTASEWGAGRVPLWNPYDGLGQPAPADPTASVFYPLQLVFALPLAIHTRLALYVALHVILALCHLYVVARHWGASASGAAAGALSYALGGHVLAQTCNPVYLVGAAWLPLALFAGERMLTLASWRWSLAFGATLALLVLGGDPQLALNTALAAGLWAWLLPRAADQSFAQVSLARGRLLLVAALAGGALAAVQIVPALQWAPHSERATFARPRSVWEALSFVTNGADDLAADDLTRGGAVWSGLFAEPLPDSHHAQIYEFSVGPWRWLEFLWPNCGGRLYPIHQRWMSALPVEGRVWSGSLYVGLLPLLAALGMFRLRLKQSHNRSTSPAAIAAAESERQEAARTCWWSWLALLGLLGSLGSYGLGWVEDALARQFADRALGNAPLAGAVGGVYWWLVVAIPGYAQFRYPAKLMVFVSVGLALLAARGFDRAWNGSWRWQVVPALLVIGSGAGIGLAAAGADWFAAIGPEFPFGPFDFAGAQRDVFLACAQTAVLASIWAALMWRVRTPAKIAAAALALTAVDLVLANGWLVAAAPGDAASSTAALMARWPQADEPPRIYRGAIDDFTPPEWDDESSPDRLIDLLRWNIASLGERTYLISRLQVVDAQTTLEPADMLALWRESAGQHDVQSPDARGVGPALGVTWRLLPVGDPASPVGVNLGFPAQRTAAYVPQQVRRLEPLASHRPAALAARTRDVFFPNGQPGPNRDFAVVECDAGEIDVRVLADTSPLEVRRLYWQRISPSHVQLEVDTSRPALVVLADYYCDGWEATLRTSDGTEHRVPLLRANRVLRGVVVDAGPCTLTFRFRPRAWYAAAAVSLTAWLALAAILGIRPRRQPARNP